MTAPVVRRDLDAGVLTLTIDRPEVRNAIDAAVHHQLGTALAAADRDPAVRVVVITGAGDVFSAGADLTALREGRSLYPEAADEARWGLAGLVRQHLAVPVIAAVSGPALGGGTEIVLACDLAVAASTATFGLPEVRHGLVAGAGGPFRLREQVPPKIAAELMLTGRPVDAATALRWGLVNDVVAPEHLAERVRRLARDVAVASRTAVRATKLMARGLSDPGEPEHETRAWAATHAWTERLRDHPDAREGLAAFHERRTPAWADA